MKYRNGTLRTGYMMKIETFLFCCVNCSWQCRYLPVPTSLCHPRSTPTRRHRPTCRSPLAQAARGVSRCRSVAWQRRPTTSRRHSVAIPTLTAFSILAKWRSRSAGTTAHGLYGRDATESALKNHVPRPMTRRLFC